MDGGEEVKIVKFPWNFIERQNYYVMSTKNIFKKKIDQVNFGLNNTLLINKNFKMGNNNVNENLITEIN